MTERTKKIILYWIAFIFVDYYLQFFSSRYWTDHALGFLKKLTH